MGVSDAAIAQKAENEKPADSDQMDVATDEQNGSESGAKAAVEKGLNPVRFRDVIEKIKEKIGMK